MSTFQVPTAYQYNSGIRESNQQNSLRLSAGARYQITGWLTMKFVFGYITVTIILAKK